jgi:hypothetical protein
MIRFGCPVCKTALEYPDGEAGREVPCPKCGQPLLISSGSGDPAADPPLGRRDEPRPKHSRLGIASFLIFIGLMVVGLDVLLAVAISPGIARSSPRDPREWNAIVVAGGWAMVCLNYLGLPLSLVGVGLGVAGLVVQRGRKHLFTWIGLCGNGFVFLAVVGLRLIGLMLHG